MIYKFIAEKLRLRLNSPFIAVGSAIPAEKVLATEFGVARMTLRKVIDVLVSEGLLERTAWQRNLRVSKGYQS